MAVEDLIEKLAFGTTTPKATHCLGLYLSPEVIYVAETRQEKGRVAVDHLVRIPVPQPDAAKTAGATGNLNTDFLGDHAKLAELMRQSMSQIKWGTKDVVVTLSHHLGLLRYFSMPAIDRRFWKSAVPLEAKKYIPIPFDILSHDFQVAPIAPDASGKPRQGALIAVSQKKNLANITALLSALGLNLIALEVAPCSVLRVWETLEPESRAIAHGQVHFDGGNIRIVLADKGFPVFFRELFLGAQASLNDLRKIDLSGCVGFVQKALASEPPKRLRVSGAAAEGLDQWAAAFGQETGVKAEVQDTAALLGIRAGDWGGYAAIGASARFTTPSPVTLDLGRVGEVTDEEKRVAFDIALLSAALSGLLFAVGLFQQGLYAFRARELSRYKRDPQLEAVFSGKTPDQIETMLKQMEQQAEAGESVSGDSPRMVNVLKEIVDSLPDKVWLTQVSVQKPLVASPQSRAELHLVGGASGGTITEEQGLSYQVRENLIKKPLISRIFPNIQIAVSAKEQAENRGAPDAAALAKRLESRTTFQLTGEAKR